MLVCFQLLQCDVERLSAEESGDFINPASNAGDVETCLCEDGSFLAAETFKSGDWCMTVFIFNTQ